MHPNSLQMHLGQNIDPPTADNQARQHQWGHTTTQDVPTTVTKKQDHQTEDPAKLGDHQEDHSQSQDKGQHIQPGLHKDHTGQPPPTHQEEHAIDRWVVSPPELPEGRGAQWETSLQSSLQDETGTETTQPGL